MMRDMEGGRPVGPIVIGFMLEGAGHGITSPLLSHGVYAPENLRTPPRDNPAARLVLTPATATWQARACTRGTSGPRPASYK